MEPTLTTAEVGPTETQEEREQGQAPEAGPPETQEAREKGQASTTIEVPAEEPKGADIRARVVCSPWCRLEAALDAKTTEHLQAAKSGWFSRPDTASREAKTRHLELESLQHKLLWQSRKAAVEDANVCFRGGRLQREELEALNEAIRDNYLRFLRLRTSAGQ